MSIFKRLTSVILVAVIMISSTTVASAANLSDVENADKAVILADLGLYYEPDENDPTDGLERPLSTQGALIRLSELYGYKDKALLMPDYQVDAALSKFEDADSVSEYAKKIIAYSAETGILSGSTQNGKYFIGAKDTVTAERFATFMLKQMGYTVADYKLSVTYLAETKGSRVDGSLTGDLTRDDAVGVMYGALTAEKSNGKTVIADIIGDNAELKAKAEKLGLLDPVKSDDLAVESVKALDCKQIEVTFNQKMDKNSAESIKFYEIYDKGEKLITLSDTSVSLSDDGKSVIITLDNKVADKLTNASEAKVVIKKNIKSANDSRLAEDVVFNVEVLDGIIPTVKEVKASGEKIIEIVFSEPVYDPVLANGINDKSISLANFSVKSGTYTYIVLSATLDRNVITLEVGTKLIEGPISVTVNNAGLDKDYAICDYAGYKVFKGEHKFDYVKDTEVAVVKVDSDVGNKVVLSFSKPVKGSNIKLYYESNGDNGKMAEATVNNYTKDITFTFDKPLPSGKINLYLVNSNENSKKIVDSYGVYVPNQTLTCVVDEPVPPADVTVISAKDNTIVLGFSKPVKGSNIMLYHTDKNILSYRAISKEDDYVDEIEFVFNSLPTGEVALYLVNSVIESERLIDCDDIYVPDQALSCVVDKKPETTYVPTPGPIIDKDAPVIIDCIVNRNNSILIKFDEELDEETALNPYNYEVKIESNEITETVPFTVDLANSRKVVELIFNDVLKDNTDYKVVVKEYKDIYGNRNTSEYVYIFNTSDYIYPEVIFDPENQETSFTVPEMGLIFITYSEAMNEEQMLNKENYRISLDDGESFESLGENDTLSLADENSDWGKRTVKIYFYKFHGLSETLPCIEIAPITNLTGVKLYNNDMPFIIGGLRPESVFIKHAYLLSSNAIRIVFNKEMKDVGDNDIVVKKSNGEAINIIASVSVTVIGRTETTFFIDTELSPDATDSEGRLIYIYTAENPTATSRWGSKLWSEEYYGILQDRVAP